MKGRRESKLEEALGQSTLTPCTTVQAKGRDQDCHASA